MTINITGVTCTVADQLAFDALDEETKRICTAIIAHETEELRGSEEAQYDRGYAEGMKDGKAEVGHDIDRRLADEFDRGNRDGYHAGYKDGFDAAQDEKAA